MADLAKMRRFWDEVTIRQGDDGYQILLDQRPVRLPQKSVLYVSSKALAEKIVKEWRGAGEKKGDTFSFSSLPMTRIAGTMIEKVAPSRDVYIDALLPYLNGDLLCYRAEQPQRLVIKQKEKWDPWISWCEKYFHIQLQVKKGIMPITQSNEAIKAFRQYLSDQNDGELAAMTVLVPALGSLILTAALKEKKTTSKVAFELAYLDEAVQAEIWGYDKEQQENLQKIQIDIQDASDFLKLIKA